jgi:hypothetical protein
MAIPEVPCSTHALRDRWICWLRMRNQKVDSLKTFTGRASVGCRCVQRRVGSGGKRFREYHRRPPAGLGILSGAGVGRVNLNDGRAALERCHSEWHKSWSGVILEIRNLTDRLGPTRYLPIRHLPTATRPRYPLHKVPTERPERGPLVWQAHFSRVEHERLRCPDDVRVEPVGEHVATSEHDVAWEFRVIQEWHFLRRRWLS